MKRRAIGTGDTSAAQPPPRLQLRNFRRERSLRSVAQFIAALGDLNQFFVAHRRVYGR
jgi:hypothetical protein